MKSLQEILTKNSNFHFLNDILAKNSNFHSLNEIVQENYKFKINRDTKVYEYQPKSWEKLKQIVDERFEKLGPGTEQEPIDFNDIDVSGMTTFHSGGYNGVGLFEKTNFEYIDVSDWDVSNVKNMSYMFCQCNNLKSVGDLSNWDVSRVSDMTGMFYGCENLELIGDLSNWDVSSVNNMNATFGHCIKLKSIGNISKWDVSKVENMRYMFSSSNITNIPDWYQE